MGPRRIGLFGGSFDPVHSAHVMMARAALNELQLDRLFIIPATRSPFKPEQQPASDEVRLAMLTAAFEEESGCEIERLELEREGASYAIDTVRAFGERFPEAELFYLIGADHVPHCPNGVRPMHLLKYSPLWYSLGQEGLRWNFLRPLPADV